MAQALSEEEFQRMQAQLLELRTNNYQLSDELRKNGVELASLRQKVAYLDKEFSKAQKALSKSKKAQEVEGLLSENEMLQAKLHSQEEDFRLQNSTLMAEFSKLCSQMEQLERENQQLKEGATGTGTIQAGPHVDGELLRLQAENTALQKNVAALQERYGKETVKSSAVSEGQGDPPGGLTPTIMAPMPLAEVELKWEMEKEEKRLLWEQLQGLESSKQAETSRLQEELAKLSEKLKKKQESFCRLQTEKETLFNDSRNKIEELQQRKEADLKAQLARTQKLQQELEAANQSLAELRDQQQGERLEHAAALRALQDQVSIQSADAQEQVEGLLAENNALRTSLAALEQIQTAKTQELNMLREQTTGLAAELQQRQTEYEDLMGQKDDLNSQLQESLRANSRLLEQLQEIGQEKEQLIQELQEARKSAEKRKAMLDELAMETLQEKSQHKEELGAVRLRHEKEVLGVRARYERELRELHEDKKRQEEELRGQIREEKARTRELENLQQTVEELQAQVHSMDGAKGWFERRLKEAEESLQQQQQEQEEALKQCQEQHTAELKGKEEELQGLRDQLQQAQEERDGHLKTISNLKQEVKDTVDGQRILEKKGSAALKDLKRQLHLERKRADKLQERLQDILTNSKSRSGEAPGQEEKATVQGLEELVLSEMNSPSRTQTGDSSSISSFSYREILREKESSAVPARSLSSSPQAQPPRPAELSDEEVAELFQRLAETQQEKWMLEEKVKHLEVSSASMAEDLCRKSAIIETYVMDSRIDVSVAAGHTDRSGLGSVLRDLVKPGDENLREMNKKLQNMLEEQLTKNMHLHKDMEVLSQEIVRLSKECVGSPDPDLEPGESS
ncbi:GRIP1 associated protein 1, transcript variant X1 [Ictidomys tridecemlineatus]|uniref:GRIP1-associated protein 1 isoform X1 n=1 Tax=Ictidomys tridecemlineatus TaxID=43179 RepID=UPI000B53FE85|nr:GRIP1-associated protein 1 isoform X1 [Ictidomys tridecemlineatus]KAG3272086.1 GRIP1 associated protein 1, transcript variant X1 [Ictidomys tridecemlineatus]